MTHTRFDLLSSLLQNRRKRSFIPRCLLVNRFISPFNLCESGNLLFVCYHLNTPGITHTSLRHRSEYVRLFLKTFLFSFLSCPRFSLTSGADVSEDDEDEEADDNGRRHQRRVLPPSGNFQDGPLWILWILITGMFGIIRFVIFSM